MKHHNIFNHLIPPKMALALAISFLVFATICSTLQASDLPVVGTENDATQILPEELQEMFGLHSGSGDVLKPLAMVIKDLRQNMGTLDPCVDLVDALNSDADLGKLRFLIVGSFHVGFFGADGDANWPYGSDENNGKLAELLFVRAKSYAQAGNELEAKRWARAALLTASSWGGTTTNRVMLQISDDKLFQSLADISDSEMVKLRAILRAREDRFNTFYSTGFLGFIYSINQIIQADNPPTPEAVDKSLRSLKGLLPLTDESKELQRDFANYAWVLLLTVREKGNAQEIHAVTAAIQEWQQSLPKDSEMQLWLSEVFTTSRRAPRVPFTLK